MRSTLATGGCLAVASDERIEAYLLYANRSGSPTRWRRTSNHWPARRHPPLAARGQRGLSDSVAPVQESNAGYPVAASRWAAVDRLLYNVHMPKYSVSMVRERLSEALDEADRGKPVLIERRGVTYELTVRKDRSRRKKATRQIDVLDRAIVEGNWTWAWKKGDLQLRTRRP